MYMCIIYEVDLQLYFYILRDNWVKIKFYQKYKIINFWNNSFRKIKIINFFIQVKHQ